MLKEYNANVKCYLNDLVNKINEDFESYLGFNPEFEILTEDNDLYTINFYKKALTFNVDFVFPEGDRPYIYIQRFDVCPTGKGVGSLLIAKLLKRLKEEKFDSIYLTSTNEQSSKFWRKVGFKNIVDIQMNDLNIDDKFYHMYSHENPNLVLKI